MQITVHIEILSAITALLLYVGTTYLRNFGIRRRRSRRRTKVARSPRFAPPPAHCFQKQVALERPFTHSRLLERFEVALSTSAAAVRRFTSALSSSPAAMALVLVISLLPASSAWAPLDVEVDPSALLPGPAVSPT